MERIRFAGIVIETNTRFDDDSNNKKHNEDMLKKHKAAAYYPGWREKIVKLQKGDAVFLYKSGTDRVAYGNADGKLKNVIVMEKKIMNIICG